MVAIASHHTFLSHIKGYFVVRVSRYIFIACFFILFSGCSEAPSEKELNRLVNVKSFTYTEQLRTIEYPGRVEARYQTELAFQVKGLLVKRLVEVGDYVKEGMPIAMLEAKDYLLASKRFAGERRAAKANHDRAERDLTRAIELRKKDFIGQSDLDRAVNVEEAAKATLQALGAQHAQSLNQRGYTQLLAPADGLVTELSVEVGDVLEAGALVAKFAWEKDWEFVTALAESNINQLTKGLVATVSFWAFPEKDYSANIREMSPVPNLGAPSYKVKLSLNKRPEKLKLGMTGHVYFSAIESKVGLLPVSSLLNSEGETKVLVVDPKTKQTHLQVVTFGKPVGDQVAILSGLKEGQLVVVAGANKVIAGAMVRLLKP